MFLVVVLELKDLIGRTWKSHRTRQARRAEHSRHGGQTRPLRRTALRY